MLCTQSIKRSDSFFVLTNHRSTSRHLEQLIIDGQCPRYPTYNTSLFGKNWFFSLLVSWMELPACWREEPRDCCTKQWNSWKLADATFQLHCHGIHREGRIACGVSSIRRHESGSPQRSTWRKNIRTTMSLWMVPWTWGHGKMWARDEQRSIAVLAMKNCSAKSDRVWEVVRVLSTSWLWNERSDSHKWMKGGTWTISS